MSSRNQKRPAHERLSPVKSNPPPKESPYKRKPKTPTKAQDDSKDKKSTLIQKIENLRNEIDEKEQRVCDLQRELEIKQEELNHIEKSDNTIKEDTD